MSGRIPRRLLDRIAIAWDRHGGILRTLGVGYLVVAATGRLSYAVPHLLWDVETWSAIDLKYRYNEVAEWFAGNHVYGVVDGAVYPPASHAILWPFMGWVSLDTARILWAITTLAAAAALALLAYRLCAPASRRDRLLVSGLAFAAYPLQLSLFVGQLGMHVAALAGWGAFLALRDRGWRADALAGALLAAALVKPTVSAPLVLGALVAGRRTRPAALVMVSYATLTLIAAAAQPVALWTLMRNWSAVAGGRVSFSEGVPNLQMLLAWADLPSWMTPVPLLVLAAMAYWIWRRRTVDPWVLMGVAGVTARIWAHGRLYDDAFLLLPVIALHRIAFHPTTPPNPIAGWLLAGAWAALLTPTWAFYDLAPVAVRAINTAQAMLWLTVLVALVLTAHVQDRPEGEEAAA